MEGDSTYCRPKFGIDKPKHMPRLTLPYHRLIIIGTTWRVIFISLYYGHKKVKILHKKYKCIQKTL